MMRIALLAALRQESRPLMKLMGGWRRVPGQSLSTWFLRSASLDLLLVETGMGSEKAGAAAQHVLDGAGIDLLLSIGFAGSLSPDLRVGHVVWSRRLATYDVASGGASSAGFDLASGLGPALCQAHPLRPARFLTVDGVRSKCEMTRRFAEYPTVVEMESTRIAAEACARHVPFLGIRAISDGSSQELDEQMVSMVDQAGRVRPVHALRVLLERPALLRPLYGLWKASRVAARNLAQTLAMLLQLPEEDLRTLAEQLQLMAMPQTDGGPAGAGPIHLGM